MNVADARIYQPAKGATQSGRANSQKWILAFEPKLARQIEPLMGWTASSDMDQEVRLIFDKKDAAINFANKYSISFTLDEPKKRRVMPKSYADNFKHDRISTKPVVDS